MLDPVVRQGGNISKILTTTRSRSSGLPWVVLLVLALAAFHGSAEAQLKKKPGGGGGGKKPKTESVIELEIWDTANLHGDVAGTPDRYVDGRLPDPTASPCVTGQRQNQRGGGNKLRFGAFVDLDRGRTDPDGLDFADCNEFRWPGGGGDRRTFTITFTSVDPDECDPCAFLVNLGGVPCSETRTVTPQVFTDNGNPRVTASYVFGAGAPDATKLHFMWNETQADGSILRYQLVSEQDLPLWRRQALSDGELVQYIADAGNPAHRFVLEETHTEAQCPNIALAVDLTYILHEIVVGQ